MSDSIESMQIDLERKAKRFAEIEGKHSRLLPRLNIYATEMADLNSKMRRLTYKLSIAKRAHTKGEDKRG